MEKYIIYNIPLRGGDTSPIWSRWDMAVGVKALLEKYELAGTWLPRYDALCNPDYTDLCLSLDDRQEVGIWLEITASHAEAAGVPYCIDDGEEWFWAKHALTMGYTQAERRRLIDVIMERYSELFGLYPRVVSMWMIDSFSADYMSRKYGIKAVGLCRNQYGIDGYTLWGGWNNLLYWPSRKYIWQPASSLEGKGDFIIYPVITEDTLINYGNEKGIWSTEVSMMQLQNLSADHVISYIRQLTEHTLQNGFPVSLVSLVVENSWDWGQLAEAYERQASHLAALHRQQVARVVTVSEIAGTYTQTYPDLSPAQIWYQPAGIKNPLLDSACITVCTRRYRARMRTDYDGTGLKMTDLRVYDEDETDPYWEEVSQGRFASWIIPFLLDGSLYHINGSSDAPLIDISSSEPTYLALRALSGKGSEHKERLCRLDEHTFLWEEERFTAEWFFGDEEIVIKTGSRFPGDTIGFELVCDCTLPEVSASKEGLSAAGFTEKSDLIKAAQIIVAGRHTPDVSLDIRSLDQQEILAGDWTALGEVSRLMIRGEQEELSLCLRPGRRPISFKEQTAAVWC